MASLNKVFLMGNLTRDPELRYLPSGKAVCEFRMAVNRTYKTRDGEQRDDTLFIDVTMWGRRGEVINEYLSKGSPIFVEGRLQLDEWKDKQTGENRSKIQVVARNFEFIGRGQDGPGEGGGRPRQGQGRPAGARGGGGGPRGGGGGSPGGGGGGGGGGSADYDFPSPSSAGQQRGNGSMANAGSGGGGGGGDEIVDDDIPF